MSVSNSTNLVPKPQLKNYVIADKLGSGTYATVYKAYRKGGQREVVAVKCVAKSSLNKTSTENLLTEIELLKNLHHEHIVQLKDFQWDDQFIYLIMEYCSGGDLSRFIRSKRTLSEQHAKRFLQQLALALQYIRSQNVSHMDLKPQNILLSSSSSPILKIADFGFAQYLYGDTNAQMLRGSPLYMAPEIVTQRQYNPKADLWSVGVILYECLFGRAPFASRTLFELGEKIKDTKPVELPYGFEISDECRNLLYGLLQRDPENRMAFEDFFAHPYVDLGHAPSADALPKAIELATKAVEKDSAGEYREAINLYCHALEYFVPAIHFEKNTRRKDVIRQQVQGYMRRAEQLKSLLKPQTTGTDCDTEETDEGQLQNTPSPSTSSRTLSQSEVRGMTANKLINHAVAKEKKEEFEDAMELYEKAIEIWLTLLKQEEDKEKKEKLQRKVSDWLSRAEKIKQYLEVRKLNTLDTSQNEEDENARLASSSQQCIVQ